MFPLGAATEGSDGQEPESGLAEESGPTSWMAQQVKFEFFSKPMVPEKVILSSSAQPWGQKRTTHTQEIIRRLLRTKKELKCSVKQQILGEYMQILKTSEYDAKT